MAAPMKPHGNRIKTNRKLDFNQVLDLINNGKSTLLVVSNIVMIIIIFKDADLDIYNHFVRFTRH